MSKLRDEVLAWMLANDACDEAFEWVESFSPEATLEEIWGHLDYHTRSIEWMVWLLYNTGTVWGTDHFILDVAVKYCPSIKKLKRYKDIKEGIYYQSELPPLGDTRNRFLDAVSNKHREEGIGNWLTVLAKDMNKHKEVLTDLKAHPYFKKLMEENK